MTMNDAGSTRMPQGSRPMRAKEGHGHLNDVGFGSLVAYFFCVLASVSIRSSGMDGGVFGRGVIVAFLAFVGATCLMLLVLAMAESYLLRHDNQKQLALASGVLMVLGPLSSAVEVVTGVPQSLPMFLAFSLSGCGYAVCLLIWGRILSQKDAGGSARQVLADTSAAVIVMVVASAMPEFPNAVVMASLGFASGVVGARKAPAADPRDDREGQVVVSDTRNAIPWSSYFAGGMPWILYGVFLALLSDVHVFGALLNIATIVVVAVAGVAGIAIVRMHRNPDIDLSKMAWASIPLLVTGLVVYVAGEQRLLSLAVVLIVLSMIISYLHLMAHFAALAHRPDLLSDQMFAWGWLAPYVGMFIGVFAGIVCRLVDNPSINLFLSVMGGILVVALIASMRSIERIAVRRREREIDRRAEEDASDNYEAHMSEVFSGIGLSAREQDVAFLLLQGRSQAVIASQLFVAASTVNTHVKHIYRKANVSSKQEFIDMCQKMLRARSSDLPGSSF